MTAAPRIVEWARLSSAERRDLLARPAQRDSAEIQASVAGIIERVRGGGDEALFALTEQFDHVRLESLRVGDDEFAAAQTALTPTEKDAIARAIGTVRSFHEAQRSSPLRIETAPGVVCERFEVPIGAVGMYVPAGTAPLPSTAIMIGVPAAIAGCEVRVLCTPPRRDGRADPAVVYAAQACGVTHVFKVGGAQAVAAMAFGTASVPKVDKIFGPGNAWVTAAKQRVAADADGAAYDMPAGPSEVMVVADERANPEFVAADLLAQAEHSRDAQALLVTTSRALAVAVHAAVERQHARLIRGDIVRSALQSCRLIVVDRLDTAIDVANIYAPEHLIIETEAPRQWLGRVRNAGSVFLGSWTPESMGDYCSGTNHVLPTYGHARAFSGLSLSDFMRRMTVQEITPEGLAGLGPVAQTLALLEGLDAHANAVTVRLAAIERPRS
ncbi:MAG: histidinol dehydrogenase [Steroidobacteraceae bacterium]